jgi:hypothetical protein
MERMWRGPSQKPKVNLTQVQTPREQRRAIGVASVILACVLGWGAATIVQAGMTYDFYIHPDAIHTVFFALGIVGMIAGAFAEGTGHGAAFEFHHTGNTVALIVNSFLYAALAATSEPTSPANPATVPRRGQGPRIGSCRCRCLFGLSFP